MMKKPIEARITTDEAGKRHVAIISEFKGYELANTGGSMFVTKPMMKGLEASIENQAKNGEDIGDTLEQYCRLWLMKQLGIVEYPLIEKDGKIIGLDGEYTVKAERKPLDAMQKRYDELKSDLEG
jgi:hypothetical protein